MIIWKVYERPLLFRPILIQGLPGIGNVGKISVEYLINKLKAKKFAELYGNIFPHHVFVDKKGIIELPKAEFYYAKSKHVDLVFLTADYQPLTPENQYEFVDEILKFSKKLGIKHIITIGGFGVEGIPEKPRLIASATDKELIEELERNNVEIDEGIVGMIVGSAGLLLGMAKLRDMRGFCLLGETFARPLFTDARAAATVLEFLNNYLELNIDLSSIEAKAKELEESINKAKEIEEQILKKIKNMQSGEELRYIG